MPYNKEAYEAKKAADSDVHRRRVYKLRYPDGNFDYYNSVTHCELCGHKLEKTGVRRKTQDHDHASGQTRGVICHSCNISLAFVDSVGIENLIHYHNKDYHLVKYKEVGVE